MGDTPRLNFPYIVSSHILDALVQPVIEGALVNTPPASPAAGVLYVVGRSPNGAWTGKAECLAQYVNDVWTFYVPFEGLTAWNKASKSRWYYSGTEWSELSDDQHGKRTDNPHKVTAEQLGAETPSGAQAKANAVQTNLMAHINSGTHNWSSITDKPGTLKDYGIGDTYTKTEADSYREEAKTQIGAEQSELGVEIKGRTLVNLLGKDGNFEVDTDGNGMADGWGLGSTAHWSTTALDTDAYIGTKSQKLVGSGNGSYTSIAKNYAISASKYYVLLANVKSPNATVCYTRFGSDSGGLTFAAHQISSSWSTICRKLNPTIDATMVQFYTAQATPNTNTFYFDGARLYEISQAEFNAIDSMTADQVAAKYPYVDSVQFKKDVLVTQSGKQLLSPFDSGDWVDNTGGYATILNNYSLQIVGVGTTSSRIYKTYVPCSPGKSYVISSDVTSNLRPGAAAGVYLYFTDINKTRIGPQIAPSGTAPANAYYIEFIINTYGFTGNVTCINPQLELASTATAFEPQVKSYAHTPIQIAQDESVWLTPNTSVYKEVWKKNVVLDGSLQWSAPGVLYTGFHRVIASLEYINKLPHGVPGDQRCTKYDMSVLYTPGVSWTSANQAQIDSQDTNSSTRLNITVSTSDTGWIDSANPSASEIKAYFYGWKMCASNGSTYVSGTKYWKKITDGTGITSTLPTASYTGYTPYVLHYKLATPVYHINYYTNDPNKPIMSAGSVVNIPQGVTQVEQKSGVVWREPATVSPLSGSYYLINMAPSYLLKNRVKSKVSIYRNGVVDLKWDTMLAVTAGGLEYYRIIPSNYDSTVNYTITYEQLDKYLYTVDTFAIDNPAPTRQRNFALDSTEQKIAYFKVNPVSLVGATANQNPKTLADYGVLDAYTKDSVDAAVNTKLNSSDSLANGTVYKYRDVTAYHLSSTATGTAKILLPVSWLASTIVLAIEGWSSAGTNVSHWDVTVSGFTQGSGNWILTAATLHPNCPFSSVRFGFDSVAGKCCILLGTTTTAWDNIKIVVKEAFIGNSNVAAYGTGWSMSIITDETTLTKIVAPTTKTLAFVESGALTVSNASVGNIRSGYFNNTDYAAGNRNYIQVRQQIASGTSYSAILGVDKNTGNVWLSNDAITVQHLSISPSGNVGIGTTTPKSLLHLHNASSAFKITGNSSYNPGMELRSSSGTGSCYIDFTNGSSDDSAYGTPDYSYRMLLDGATGNFKLVTTNGGTTSPLTINGSTGIGIFNTDPKATLHSTGSTILGIDRSTLNYNNIGNSQMQMSLSESDNVLWLDVKRSDGTIKQIGVPLGTSTIITGTNLWISSEYQPVVNTVTSVAHGLTLDPVRCRCDVLLKCVVAQGNYSVGDFAMGVIVNVGGSAEFVLSPALDSTNIRVNSGSGGPYAMNKTTGAYFQVTPANWRYVFRIWY